MKERKEGRMRKGSDVKTGWIEGRSYGWII